MYTDRVPRKTSHISRPHLSSRQRNENLTQRSQVKVKERKRKNMSFGTLSFFLPTNFLAKGLRATAFTLARIAKKVHRGHWPRSRSENNLILLSYHFFRSPAYLLAKGLYRSSRHSTQKNYPEVTFHVNVKGQGHGAKKK